MLSFGVSKSKLITVKAGDNLTVGKLNITVLEGRHYRHGNTGGVPAVGYLIKSDDSPSLAFPTDVRNYDTADLTTLNADYCFAHLWLTDEPLDPESYVPKAKEFAPFMLKHSQKNIIITHLYESGRKADGMWQKHHAETAKEVIKAISPTTNVIIPNYCDAIKLI